MSQPYKDLPAGITSPVFQSEKSSKPIDGTDDLMWAETYIQTRADHAPQAIGTESSRHSGFYLVEETPIESVGPENSGLVEFTRTYAEVPATRDEAVTVSFSYPGKSLGAGANWDRYGLRKPVTIQLVPGSDEVSYFISEDGSTTIPEYTVPLLDGEIVDFFGPAYETTPPYTFIGNTDPLSEPSSYVIGCTVQRWKGKIWEKRVRTVPDPSAILGA